MKEGMLLAVILGSLASCVFCTSAFYTKAAYLEDVGLGGQETLLDQFLRFSVLTLILAAFFGVMFSLIVRPWARGFACVIFFEIFVHHFSTMIVFSTMKHQIVDGYASFFLPGVEAGTSFQSRYMCCGWGETQGTGCNSTVPCRSIAEEIFPGNSAVFYTLMVLATLCDLLVFGACVSLVNSSYAPVPKFEVSEPHGTRLYMFG